MVSDKEHREMKNQDHNIGLTRIFWVALLICVYGTAFSQESGSCAEKLRNAQLLFEKGQVEQIPSLLRDCLKSGFKKEEELAAYKLLIQTCLLNDRIEQADSAMMAFLKRNPEYQISPTDHSSFTYVYSNFIVKPVLQIGLHTGINIPFLTFLDENLTAGEPVKSVFRTNAANLLLTAEARFSLGNKMELGIEAGYSHLKFTDRVEYMKFGVINYTEVQQILEIPVNILYNLKSSGKFTPYGRTGAGVALNLITTADVSFEVTDKNNPNDRTGETVVRTDSRIPVDIFVQLGAGIKYKIPRGYIFTEIRSNFGIVQQNVRGGKTVDLLEHYYLWSDPGFRINTFSLNAGYIYIFYKPSKRNL
jgi:hypothetical protein